MRPQGGALIQWTESGTTETTESFLPLFPSPKEVTRPGSGMMAVSKLVRKLSPETELSGTFILYFSAFKIVRK